MLLLAMATGGRSPESPATRFRESVNLLCKLSLTIGMQGPSSLMGANLPMASDWLDGSTEVQDP